MEDNNVRYSTLRLYMTDYEEGVDIPFDKCIEASLEQALLRMINLSCVDGCFLGLILPNEMAVQFMCEKDGRILLDIPDVALGGTHYKLIGPAECLEIIKEMFSGKDPRHWRGLNFESF